MIGLVVAGIVLLVGVLAIIVVIGAAEQGERK